jgi:dTMP kinase
MNSKGRFIVIEGIDGCGGETQTNFLSDFLTKKGYNIKLKSYPEYDKPIGEMIHHFLHKKYDFPIDTETLMYFSDFTKDTVEMEKMLESGNIIIADRYFTSTIVYQCLKGFSLEKMLKLAEIFRLPKPDICIYIKISAETSFNRKTKEKGGNLDRHEENKKFLSEVANGYEKAAVDNTFCEWKIIDGEKPIEEVSKSILEILNKKFGI